MRKYLRLVLSICAALTLVLLGVALSWGYGQARHMWNDHAQIHGLILIINELGRRDPTLIPAALAAAGVQPPDLPLVEGVPAEEDPLESP